MDDFSHFWPSVRRTATELQFANTKMHILQFAKTFAQIYSCCRSIKTSEMLEGKLQASQSVFLYASNDLNLNSSVNWTWIVKNAIYCSLMLTINLNMVFEKILD